VDDPDAALIARVLADDDRGAFATLVNRHQAALRAFLRRVCAGDQARADDLAQDAFVRAWGALSGFRGGSRFSTWLHRIAFNLYLSDRSRFAGRAARDDLPAPGSVDLDEGERAVTRRQLERALGQLSIPERAAVSLMYGQGATQEEIAELLDCPVGTVKTHLARGKQKLRALLSAGGETAAAPAGEGRP
jgi:RNA polymerase sigma-70 factor (ECF subfamily)